MIRKSRDMTHRKHVQNNVSKPPTSTHHHDDNLPVSSLRHIHAYIIIVTIATVCYGSSHSAEFVFDDSEAIINNKDLRPEVPISALFEHDFWGAKLISNTSHKSYRPLTVLTFRLNYYLAGGLHPRGFHVTNIVLHSIVCALLLPVFSILLEVKGQGCEGRVGKAPLLCALLFAVHPIHTESVAGVVGRADLLCAVTFLLSLLAYHRAVHRSESHNPGVFGCDWFYLLLSMLLCVIATFCKEMGITVLGVCFAYDILVVSRIDPLQILRIRKSEHEKSKRDVLPWTLLLRILVLTSTGLLVLLLRWRVQGSTPPLFQVVDNPHSFINNTLLRILNYNYIYSLNAWLLLNPWWLCFDWSVGCVPVIESLLDARLLAVAAFWFVLGSVIGCCLKQAPCRDQRRLAMALAFLIVPFLPATNILFRVGFVVAERVLYLPSVGFVMLLVLGVRHLSSVWRNKLVWQMLTMMMLVTYALRSYRRCQDWQTDQKLFESGELVCPLNAKVHYNIAKIHGDKGNISFAIEKYKHAISLHPEYDQAMNNLANILKEQGELVGAERLLLQATNIRPNFAAAWMNLGIVQASLNKSELSEHSYFNALKHRRKYPDCYYNLGNLYLSDKKYPAALSAWRNATLQKPTHINAWNNLIILLDSLGRLSDIEVAVKEAWCHLPGDSGLHYNYANALGKAGKFPEAEEQYLKAIQGNPAIPSYYSNLAVLYHRWGKLDKAEELYVKALHMDPNSPTLQANYKLLLQKLGKSDEL